MSPELIAALKRLRLGGLLPTLPERLQLAAASSQPYEDVLLMLLTDEISRRDSTASARRAEVAGLDPGMTFERWDKSSKVTYDRRVLAEVMSLRFIEAHRNVASSDPSAWARSYCPARSAISLAEADSMSASPEPTRSCASSSRAGWTTPARR